MTPFERQRLVGDAITLERAARVLRRRYAHLLAYEPAQLEHYAEELRKEAGDGQAQAAAQRHDQGTAAG